MGLGEMAQWIGSLCCKQKELNLDLDNPDKVDVIEPTCNPSSTRLKGVR